MVKLVTFILASFIFSGICQAMISAKNFGSPTQVNQETNFFDNIENLKATDEGGENFENSPSDFDLRKVVTYLKLFDFRYPMARVMPNILDHYLAKDEKSYYFNSNIIDYLLNIEGIYRPITLDCKLFVQFAGIVKELILKKKIMDQFSVFFNREGYHEARFGEQYLTLDYNKFPTAVLNLQNSDLADKGHWLLPMGNNTKGEKLWMGLSDQGVQVLTFEEWKSRIIASLLKIVENPPNVHASRADLQQHILANMLKMAYPEIFEIENWVLSE